MVRSNKTVEVQGLMYNLPEMPPIETIRNFGLPRHEQVWKRRIDFEDYFWGDGWEVDPDPKQLRLLSDELDRLFDGEWIIIDGQPVYFNRYAYFFHQWFVLETGDYPDYRDTSLEFMRFYEMCVKHPLCMGMVLIKGRRLGATSMSESIQLLNAITEKNTLQGITSKTKEDAKEAFKMVVNGFNNLPVFLKPKISGNEAAANELYVREQPKRVKQNVKVSSTGEGLNNRVNYLAPSENTYDGRRLFSVLVDEAGKMPVEMSVDKYWTVLKKCLQKGARVVGKCIMITTVNVAEKGGAEFKKIWDASNTEERDELGRTTSGLWRFFIPGWKGYDGYVDQFGNSVWDTPTPDQSIYLESIGCPNPKIGAKQYTDELKEKVRSDNEKYMEELRLCPSTWQEVFKSASSATYFNHLRTTEQLEKVKAQLLAEGKDQEKGELGRPGWFFKVNGRVKFIDDPKGMWYAHKLLPDEESNQFYMKGMKKFPANTALGAAGLDPIATTRLTVDKGSDASIVIRERTSSLDNSKGGIMAFFVGRPETKKFFHEQLFNALEYYGVKVLGELAPDDWVTYAEDPDNNLTGYLIVTQNSSGKDMFGIAPQNKQAREHHLTLMVESSRSDTEKIWVRRLLQDRLGFDPDDRTVYDACMADGYALMGLQEAYDAPKPRKKPKKVLAKGSISVG